MNTKAGEIASAILIILGFLMFIFPIIFMIYYASMDKSLPWWVYLIMGIGFFMVIIGIIILTVTNQKLVSHVCL